MKDKNQIAIDFKPANKKFIEHCETLVRRMEKAELDEAYNLAEVTNLIFDEGDQILKNPIVAGIYFLIKDNQIIYIGKSIDIYSRITQHAKGYSGYDPKSFDFAVYREFPADDLEFLEKELIKYHLPPLNADANTRKLKREKSKATGIVYANQHLFKHINQRRSTAI